VAAACKLVGADGLPRERREFDDQVISAFGEAFNNAALHAYQGRPPGDVEIDLEVGPGSLTIRMRDFGKSFDIEHVPEPDLDALPESGLGIYIIKSFMDVVQYQAGEPNELLMKKWLGGKRS
jgi:serine/threonine-protein kinase RsbW